MSTTLKRQTKRLLDGLSEQQLRAANEFILFVSSRDLDPATLELLAIPGFEASFDRGLRDIHSGRTRPWKQMADKKAQRNVRR